MTEPSHPSILLDPYFSSKLRAIDAALGATKTPSIVDLFADFPLDVFGLLLLERPDAFPNIKAYFPAMPPDDLQSAWVGSAGVPLLLQSVQFTRSVVAALVKHGRKSCRDATVLDYGCGWGRLLRLLYKYVPESQLHGMDAWQNILDVARQLGVRGRLHKIDEYPENLPGVESFDLAYAFSIFTHLSELAGEKAVAAIRERTSTDGVLVVTIRPVGYWDHARHPQRRKLEADHRRNGFAFVPDARLKPGAHGDVPYGEASMSIEFIEARWRGWRVVDTDYNLIDPYQLVVVLRRV